MIGPPGLPKIGRRVFQFNASRRDRLRVPLRAFKWAVVLYFAGAVAHFGHHVAFDLPAAGVRRSLHSVLAGAPVSLAWPADLIGTLLTSS